MTKAPDYPIDDIRWILHACAADEALAAEDKRYYDFTALRGGASVVTELADTLEQHCVQDGETHTEYHHQILCGHRGTGKSTELNKLREWANKNGFLCIWMDVEKYFGSGELHNADFFLIAAEQVVSAMNEEVRLPMEGNYLDNIRDWFYEVILEEKDKSVSRLDVEAGVKAKGGIPLIAELFAKFKAKREDSTEHLKTVRNRLRQQESTLVDMTRTLMQAAAKQLAGNRPRGLLLIFDSLDKYPQDNIEKLLHTSSSLRRLACHVVYTMHINLMYRPKAPYWDIYNTPVVLPMLALKARNIVWKATVQESLFHEEAVEELLTALKKRIVVEELFEHPEDARLLVKMSGGCIRDLMHLVNMARKKSRSGISQPLQKLTTAGVQAAIAEYRLVLTEGLEAADYDQLALIARQKEYEDRLDETTLKLLNRRAVLRYARDGVRWSDVHPLVVETTGFQHAYNTSAPLASK